MRILLYAILMCSSLLPVTCTAEQHPKSLDSVQAQKALIDYMRAHPDAFAGFTPYLLSDSAKVILSEDKRTAHIGRIVVDLVDGTYRFEHWTENPGKRSGTTVIWNGMFMTGKNGELELSTPSLTQEKWVQR